MLTNIAPGIHLMARDSHLGVCGFDGSFGSPQFVTCRLCLDYLRRQRTMSRRRFIFLGTAAAAAVVAGPLVELAPTPELAIDWGANPSFTHIDKLLKEFYEPVLCEMINNKNALTRFLIEDGRIELPIR